MVSWANVAGKEAAPPPVDKQPSVAVSEVQTTSTAVVDANAIIAGMHLERLADQAVTISEVLQEIRDQRSREYLQNFPHGIKAVQPNKESIAAGTLGLFAHVHQVNILLPNVLRLRGPLLKSLLVPRECGTP